MIVYCQGATEQITAANSFKNQLLQKPSISSWLLIKDKIRIYAQVVEITRMLDSCSKVGIVFLKLKRKRVNFVWLTDIYESHAVTFFLLDSISQTDLFDPIGTTTLGQSGSLFSKSILRISL